MKHLKPTKMNSPALVHLCIIDENQFYVKIQNVFCKAQSL